MMIKQDDQGDFMLIMYEGKAMVLVDGNQVAEKNVNDVVGEAALQTKQKRRATVVAITKCRCLVISKDDYDSAIDLFKTLQKRKIHLIMNQVSLLKSWNLVKIRAFTQLLSETNFAKGQLIYNLGQSAECLYIVKSGRVALDIYYEIERTISIPVGHQQWEL